MPRVPGKATTTPRASVANFPKMMLPSYLVATLVRRTVKLLNFKPWRSHSPPPPKKKNQKKTNPFSWWKLNQFSQITLSYICSPATPVHSEHICSIADGTVCAVLDSDTVDKLVFLNKRFKSVSVQPSVYVKRFSKHGPQTSVVKVEPNLPS